MNDFISPVPRAAAHSLWPALLAGDDRLREDLCLVSASGHRLHFADGREVLCGTSGLWNVNLGYGNEAVTRAVTRALQEASYLSVFRYTNVWAQAAADALLELAGRERYDRVVFSTSGGAANDAVLKLVRQYHAARGDAGRKVVVGLLGSYHGLTYGGFSLTGENLGQQLYGVDPRFVRHVPPNDPEALAALLEAEGRRIAAVVVEPVLGSGTVELAAEYLAQLQRLRERHGFLLVVDEVATGFGRTGPMFASESWQPAPDVLIASKGLTNGAAAAAAIAVGPRVSRVFDSSGQVFVHAETQAGTPATCAAIVAVAEEFARLDALTLCARAARTLDDGLRALVASEPRGAQVTGRGLFRTLRLSDDSGASIGPAVVARLVAAVRGAGAVVHPGPGGIQLIPALTYTDAEVTALLASVRDGIAEVADDGGFAAETDGGFAAAAAGELAS